VTKRELWWARWLHRLTAPSLVRCSACEGHMSVGAGPGSAVAGPSSCLPTGAAFGPCAGSLTWLRPCSAAGGQVIAKLRPQVAAALQLAHKLDLQVMAGVEGHHMAHWQAPMPRLRCQGQVALQAGR
jgi:hypothetical protein